MPSSDQSWYRSLAAGNSDPLTRVKKAGQVCHAMKRSRITEEQIAFALKQQEVGT
jgi:hypothetical protein